MGKVASAYISALADLYENAAAANLNITPPRLTAVVLLRLGDGYDDGKWGGAVLP